MGARACVTVCRKYSQLETSPTVIKNIITLIAIITASGTKYTTQVNLPDDIVRLGARLT